MNNNILQEPSYTFDADENVLMLFEELCKKISPAEKDGTFQFMNARYENDIFSTVSYDIDKDGIHFYFKREELKIKWNKYPFHEVVTNSD